MFTYNFTLFNVPLPVFKVKTAVQKHICTCWLKVQIYSLFLIIELYKQTFQDFSSPEQSSNTAAMPPPGVCMNIINARHKKDGYGSITNPERFLKQDFQQLKQYCVIRRVRFIDEMFPPDRNSIGKNLLSPSDMARVVWLRPGVSVLLAENATVIPYHIKC